MRQIILLTCLLCYFASHNLNAQIPLLQAMQDTVLAWKGDLKEGRMLSDLSWGWNSSNACFTEPQSEYFRGHHVIYRSELFAYSTMIITLVPDDPKQEMSLWAYSGSGDMLPPTLYRCVSCEADYPKDRPQRGRQRPDYVRQIELRAVRNPYPITVGVSGPDGALSGGYTLQISWKRNR